MTNKCIPNTINVPIIRIISSPSLSAIATVEDEVEDDVEKKNEKAGKSKD